MTYYCFNKCTEDDLAKIEKLVEEMNSSERNASDGKSWDCHPFENLDDLFFVIYHKKNPPHGYPLVLQTMPSELNHNNPEVMSILRQFIDICQPTSISDGALREYDMTIFK